MTSISMYDVIVVGGGHAGIEAAFAAHRMGCNTLLITSTIERIGELPCNPAIGGIGKSQLVFEIDALGGIQGWITDRCGIHFKMLNKSKGPAVWSLRAQVDRKRYMESIKDVVLKSGFSLAEELITDIITEGKRVIGVRTKKNEYLSKATVLTTGTFLSGIIHIGTKRFPAGRYGEPPASGLSDSLKKLGFTLGRLKTGTSARVKRESVDIEGMIVQKPDEHPAHFSHRTEKFDPPRLSCYITHTTEATHKIIYENLEMSPWIKGKIKATGVRYCPSIEDKLVKFPDKKSHHVFVEPDGLESDIFYLGGVSTSLPEEIQLDFLHTIPGLDKAEITQPGYAIEYDFVLPTQLYPTLETKHLENLFLAGQINGTSGYEEAAAQGIMAGINAVLKLKDKAPFILPRSSAYIGVLIDDLVTKGTKEPYRMFTSRVEHRLLLRQDNADERLMEYGRSFNLVEEKAYKAMEAKKETVHQVIERLKSTYIGEKDIVGLGIDAEPGLSLFTILKRPEVNIENICQFIGDISDRVAEEVQILAKYDGYIKKEEEKIKRYRELEDWKIPEDFDYGMVRSLSNETKDKLSSIRPLTLGQASRIPGIRPNDIILLSIWFKRCRARLPDCRQAS
ncbi:MAG: tRNA uridine-5-carboxymethylaminomethyl(34) synthesis enzyme MnmG [bacterium (Candidatus Stahlbacteria) CG23_combo_of_CG06-09_8_20_14_all_40_9]|nr:MAG: tRNA uridine-5-carboxymethylaminomethyl(34) synthesis enzyme MnmG [bacterium (Candidatus Stahlbacteria) CG23_combo_of_CG06-09_8_20_14_all_40_9]